MSSTMTQYREKPSFFYQLLSAVAISSMLVIPLIGWLFYLGCAMSITTRRKRSVGLSWDLLALWIVWPVLHCLMYLMMPGGLGSDAAGTVMFLQGVMSVCVLCYYSMTTEP